MLKYEHTTITGLVCILAVYGLECGIIGFLGHGLSEKQITTYKLLGVCCLVMVSILMLSAVTYWDLYFLLQLLVIFGFVAAVVCIMAMIRLNQVWDEQGFFSLQKADEQNPKFANLKQYSAWHGDAPAKVSDFAVPRYVYENLAETKKPTPQNGKIIGYRIGPELVIRNAVSPSKGWHKDDIQSFIDHFGGKLLNHENANVLRHYWDIISEMRQATGEPPLPLPYFWYQDEYGIASGHYREDFNEIDPTESAIVLKF